MPILRKTIFALALFAATMLVVVSGARAQEVVFLTSFKSARLEAKLDRLIKKHTRADLQATIIHQADQLALDQALSNPKLVALVWVSHGSYLKRRGMTSEVEAISAAPLLTDYRGDNVAPLFLKLRSSVRFLAVVGCSSDQILSYYGFKRDDVMTTETYLPTKKVVAQWALKRAIRGLNSALDETTTVPPLITENQTQAGIALQILREFKPSVAPQDRRSLRVWAGTQLLGVIPAPQEGDSSTVTITLPAALLNQNLKFESGESAYKDLDDDTIGMITLTSELGSSWKLFTDPKGQPFGVNFRLFIKQSAR